jgi:DNA helicase-2/ATP-dependent DNA helicase PcrA
MMMSATPGAVKTILTQNQRQQRAPPVKTTSILAKAHVPSADFKPSDTSNLQVGMQVEHERFGFGKVISLEGNKPDIKATIFFKEIGQKQLLLKFAKLSIIQWGE